MKKTIYILLFTLLTLLLSLLLHALIELTALWIITGDMNTYNNSYVWQNWVRLHQVFGAVLWITGILLGVWGGFRYWRILYIEKRYGTPRF